MSVVGIVGKGERLVRKMMLVTALGVTSACATDDTMHFAAGHFVSRYVTERTGSPFQGCLASLGVGVLKEVYDHNYGGDVEGSDVFFTGAGCAVTVEF